jgi:hypothetical protein
MASEGIVAGHAKLSRRLLRQRHTRIGSIATTARALPALTSPKTEHRAERVWRINLNKRTAALPVDWGTKEGP